MVFPKLQNALNTMLDSMLTEQVLGQPQNQIKRGAVALVTTKLTGRSLSSATITASSVDLQMDTVDEDGSESDPDATVEVKVRTRLPGSTSIKKQKQKFL